MFILDLIIGLKLIGAAKTIFDAVNQKKETTPSTSNIDADTFTSSDSTETDEIDPKALYQSAAELHNMSLNPLLDLTEEERDTFRKDAQMFATIAQEFNLQNKGIPQAEIDRIKSSRGASVYRLGPHVLQNPTLAEIFKNIPIPPASNSHPMDLMSGLVPEDLPPTLDEIAQNMFYEINPRAGRLSGSNFGNISGANSTNEIMDLIDEMRSNTKNETQSILGSGDNFENEVNNMISSLHFEVKNATKSILKEAPPYRNEVDDLISGLWAEGQAETQRILNTRFTKPSANELFLMDTDRAMKNILSLDPDYLIPDR